MDGVNPPITLLGLIRLDDPITPQRINSGKPHMIEDAESFSLPSRSTEPLQYGQHKEANICLYMNKPFSSPRQNSILLFSDFMCPKTHKNVVLARVMFTSRKKSPHNRRIQVRRATKMNWL